jgi:hypothetical protein
VRASPVVARGVPGCDRGHAGVDEHVDERVEVGKRAPVAQVRTLDAQGNGLAVDALAGGTLAVDAPERLAVAVQFMAHPILWLWSKPPDGSAAV